MFSHLAIMVLDANFINIPTRQLAGFLFFILLHKEDAKKTELIIDKIIHPKSNESMWYFRPLELLEGFFSSVFKLVVLEFIS